MSLVTSSGAAPLPSSSSSPSRSLPTSTLVHNASPSAGLSPSSNGPKSRAVALVKGSSPLSSSPSPNHSSTAVIPYEDADAAAALAHQVTLTKAAFNDAQLAELDAGAVVKKLQADLLQYQTDPKYKDQSQLIAAKQQALREAEATWTGYGQFTAELRAELSSLSKMRHGDYSDEHVKYSGIHSLDCCKPIPRTAEEISTEKQLVARPAYPEVDPRLGENRSHPNARVTEDVMRRTFAKLVVPPRVEMQHDLEEPTTTIERLVQHLEGTGLDFGVPGYAEKIIREVLKAHRSAPKEGGRLTFAQTQCVLLRWASL